MKGMCIVCANAVRKYFPLLTPSQQLEILWCGTAFPAGCGERVDEQLAELEQKSNGNFEDAMRITHEEFDEVWEATRHLRARWDEKEKRWIEPEEKALAAL